MKSVDRYILLFALAYMPIHSVDVLAVNWVQYQAEAGSWSAGGTVDNDHIGYTGTGFVNADYGTGQWVEITVNVPGDADYDISVRYALRNGTEFNDRPALVEVGGVEAIARLPFPTTANWHDWTTVDFTLTLTAGDNAIRFTSLEVGGLANFDRLDVDDDVDFMYWSADFAPIVLADLTYHDQVETGTSTITLFISSDVDISADNSTVARLDGSNGDYIFTKYKLIFDGNGVDDTGATDTGMEKYDEFLIPPVRVTYVPDDYGVEVKLKVRAKPFAFGADDLADAGLYSAV